MKSSAKFIIPQKYLFRDTYEQVLYNLDKVENPFVALMGARFSHAANSCESIDLVSEFSDFTNDTYYFIRDVFLDVLDIELINTNLARTSNTELVVINALSTYSQKNLSISLSAHHPPSIIAADKFISYDATRFIKYGYNETINYLNNITLPLGTADEWLSSVQYEIGTILLDEPHEIVIQNLTDLNNINVQNYIRALNLCKELSRIGFKVRTFCRTESDKLLDLLKQYNFIEILSFGKWICYSDMLSIYAKHELFFSHFQETFGFPICESLQSGRPVICFIENANQSILRHYQNSVLLSIYQSKYSAISLITDYITKLRKGNFSSQIKKDSYLSLSTNTFCSRLLAIMSNNRLL